MRPTRLELEGFASFRRPTEVDLDGADLFVLSGPTGAGKSSLIDAMVFALYGSVPRYDDRRLVAPAITQGQQQARVRLTFAVDGERYTATRVVRRVDERRATTKEARLERLVDGGDPVVEASGADEVTARVERLLGLTFDHFTRTVVLPQGDVQEFLHAKPKDRQDLLVRLLDLDVYRRVAALARERGKRADAEVTVLTDRLGGDLANATEEALAEAKARVAVLEEVQDHVDAARPDLDALVERGHAARRAADEAAGRLTAVSGLAPPDDLDTLLDALDTTATAVSDAERAVETAAAAREAADAAVAALPAGHAIETAIDLLRRRDEAVATVEAAGSEVAAATTRAAEADERARAAREHAAAAADALRRLERRHLAHAVATDLQVGSPCPVCEHPVEAIPERDAPADLDAASEAAREADTAAAAAERAQRDAEAQRARAVATHEHAVAARDDAAGRLDAAVDGLGVPADGERLRARLAEVAAAEAERERARRAEDEARRALDAAKRHAGELDEARTAAWRAFDDARDRLAAIGPPSVDRNDLRAAWSALLAWRDEVRPGVERARADAEAAIAAAETAYRERLAVLRGQAEEAGVDASGNFPAIERACVTALAAARKDRDRVEQDLRTAQELRSQLDEARRHAELGRALGMHLNAKNFEQWLLNRALKRLVVGATRILGELTGGAYALDVGADGTFEVVDHRNADERRSVRTLSGGETFLASLALALSLAEHVAELAAHGSARLEALFLDEGFGTLDAETLDTVAAAVEELGAQGRMVGLITHVRDLADRIPVRFEVRRTASTSTVERVEVGTGAVTA